MKLDFKNVVIPAFILCLICVCVTAALAFTNMLTSDKIEEQQLATAENARKIVLSSADSFEFQEDDNYYLGFAGTELAGYVFETESKGYGGTIRVMTGIGLDGNITGISLLSHAETPGLGTNAEKEEFTNMFLQPAAKLEVIKYQTPSEGQIEALTGATITSVAVTNAVNLATEKYMEVIG